MALNEVIFNVSAAGLGRPLAGEDHFSGMLFYLTDANLPSGFGTSDRVKKVFSIQDVEGLGITKGSATNGVIWYHMNQLFKANPGAVVWLGIYGGASGATDLSKVTDLINEAEGSIRQIGIFDAETFAVGNLATLQGYLDTADNEYAPVSVMYAADFSATTASALVDTVPQGAGRVTVVISEDGAGEGAALAVSEGYSITNLGQVVGTVSAAKVSESIGWIEKFNITVEGEMGVPALATGELVKDLSTALLTTLKQYGYLFARKRRGLVGAYFEGNPTSVVGDFNTIRANRTMDKAKRNVRTNMLPNISAPVFVDENGQLSEDTISKFKNDAKRALEQMERDEEISAGGIDIDPTQNVLSTDRLELTVKIVPVGAANEIKVNIGFDTAL